MAPGSSGTSSITSGAVTDPSPVGARSPSVARSSLLKGLLNGDLNGLLNGEARRDAVPGP